MDVIVTSLLPLALLVVLGAALLRLGFYPPAFRAGLDRLVYWVCLPALMFLSLVEAPPSGVEGAGPMALALGLATLGVAALGVLIAVGLRMKRVEAGVFVQAALRGNLAFVGLPVVALAVDGDAGTMAKAALLLAPTVLLFNVLSVLALVGAARLGHPEMRWWPALRGLVVTLAINPLILACAAGLLVWSAGIDLGPVVGDTLDLLGKPSAALALLSLGGAVVEHPVRGRVGFAVTSSVVKCFVVPALAWLLCAWLGVTGMDRQVVLIFAACPTAVASFVLTTQLGGDGPFAAASIVVSTVLSAVGLALALWVGG